MLSVEFRCQGQTYCLRHFKPFILEVKAKAEGSRVYKVRVEFVTSHCFTKKRETIDTPDTLVRAFGEERTFCPVRYARSLDIQDVIAWASGGRVHFASEWRRKDRRFLVVKTPKDDDPLVMAFDTDKAKPKAPYDAVMRVISAYPAPGMPRLRQNIYFPTLIEKTVNGESISRPDPTRGGRR